ncbi:MAG: diguanylate cyclase [Clostridiales Family XIII bacterium]|jgi:diguanylate cyclase (GGDEF)-like protein|nr:diguanylate cyclase [Clostridiales Family XIII bacterium]
MSEQIHGILAVDDERMNLAVLDKILSPEYKVCTASSGKEALASAAEAPPDLILLDIVMPDMSGFDVLTRLKESPLTRNIPVIFITGLRDEEDEERGFALGAVDYITKPFKNTIVLARVRTHIQIVSQMRTIERLGLIDPLTNIANRRSFNDRINLEWRRSIRKKLPVSFLMMDLDNFKQYNDTYGHPQGDALLKTVAGIFAAEAKRSSDLAVRLGGEEFGVLLPDTDLVGALDIAERIRRGVEAARIPTADGRASTSATVSIGAVSAVPSEKDDLRDFIEKADENLYRAKNTGKNKICGAE